MSSRLRFRLDHRWTPPRTSAYLDGELSARERRRVERHTAECPECRDLLEGLAALLAELHALGGQGGRSVAGDVLVGVRAQLQGESP